MCQKRWRKKSQRGKSRNQKSQVSKPSQGSVSRRGLTKDPTKVPGKARPRDGHRGSAGGGVGGRQGTCLGVGAHGMGETDC